MKTIELTYDQIDTILIGELQECYSRLSDTKEIYPNLLESIDVVLRHYMPLEEYLEWEDKKND